MRSRLLNGSRVKMNERSMPPYITDIAERMWPSLGETARKLINTNVKGSVLQFDRGEDGKIYELAPIWFEKTQNRPKQKYTRVTRIVMTLAKLIYVPPSVDELPDKWVRRFALLVDRLAETGRIKYGTLGSPISMVLADISPDRRLMAALYCFSDFDREELNEWLGNEAFIKEGGIGTDDWSGLPE